MISKVELNNELRSAKFKDVINKWILIKSLPLGKVIIKPTVSTFNETPSLIIDEDLTISVDGLWVIRNENGSKVYLRDGSELSFYCSTYALSSESLLNLCRDSIKLLDLSTNNEEVILSGCQDVRVDFIDNSIALLHGNGRNYLILPQMRNTVLEIQDLHHAESRTTVLLVFKHKRKYYASIAFKHLGLINTYELDKCASVKELKVGDGLGVVKCRDSNYLVSFNGVFKIPFIAEPIAHIGHEYILYDDTFSILIRFDGRNFNQLLIRSKPKVVGKLSTGELIIIVNNNPYIITDNVWKILTGSKVLYGVADDEYIILRGLKSLEIYKSTTHISSYRPLECTLINKNLICLYGSDALIYDLSELYEADIVVKHGNLSTTGFPIMSIIPWYVNSHLSVRGPVTLLPNRDGDVKDLKSFTIKPLVLGKEITLKVVHDLILTQIVKELKIKTERVEVKELTIDEVKHSLNGFIDGGDDNTLISMHLNVFNPTPEDIPLTIKYASGEGNGTTIKSLHQILRPGVNDLNITTALRITTNSLQVSTEYTWFNKVEQLAMIALDLSKYSIEDPIIDISYEVKQLSNCESRIIATPTYLHGLEIPIYLTVSCLDGKVYNGINEVTLNECLLPAIIKYSYKYDIYEWRKYHIIRDRPLVKVDITHVNDYDVGVYEKIKCVEGFSLKEVGLDLKVPHPVSRLSVEPFINNGVKLGISFDLHAEGVIYALVGDKLASLRGSKGFLELEVDDIITRNLKVLVLSGGIKELYFLDNLALIKKYVELGVNAATLLKGKVSIRENYGEQLGAP